MQQSTTSSALTAAASRRVANQLGRAFRGTYGARTGLRTIVRALARQMLVAGASEHDVADAFEQCVRSHPDRLAAAHGKHLLSGEANCTILVELTRMCVADVALHVNELVPSRRRG